MSAIGMHNYNRDAHSSGGGITWVGFYAIYSAVLNSTAPVSVFGLFLLYQTSCNRFVCVQCIVLRMDNEHHMLRFLQHSGLALQSGSITWISKTLCGLFPPVYTYTTHIYIYMICQDRLFSGKPNLPIEAAGTKPREETCGTSMEPKMKERR